MAYFPSRLEKGIYSFRKASFQNIFSIDENPFCCRGTTFLNKKS